MKLQFSTKLFPSVHQNLQKCLFPSRVLASLFSTKILTQPSSSSSTSSSMLCDCIQIIKDPKASVTPVLEQWVSEGNPVQKSQLQHLVHLMKRFNRFNHALEISQWMTDRRYFWLSATDAAVRLTLIYRVHGLEHAENYFKRISNNIKTYSTYGALLGAYMQEKSVQKAESLMQQMREKGMITSSFPYNMLMSLYAQTGDFDKINPLMNEMKKNKIPLDIYTMRNLMMAFINESNVSGMEKILHQIEEDPQFDLHWKVYSLAANGYLKVGQTEMALKMLKKMEGMAITNLQAKKLKLAFNHLISLYARVGNKDELYRVWNTYKPTTGSAVTSFANMISSLSKLDDIEGAEKIFAEWESQCTTYDFRVLDRLLAAYCVRGLFEKAESALAKAVQGRTPYASTLSIMTKGYLERNEMPKAVEMFKRTIKVARESFRPSPIILTACLEYLEGQGDVEGMEEMIRLLKNSEPLTRDMYHRLLRTYAGAGKSVTDILDQMKMHGFAVDEETNKILEIRSSL